MGNQKGDKHKPVFTELKKNKSKEKLKEPKGEAFS